VHSTRKFLIAAVGATIMLASCSSSTKSASSTSGGSSSAGTSAPGVTKTEIHIGGLYYKAFYGDSELGARARIKRENDAGGVNGRKIVLDTMIDEGQDANQDLTAAKALVQQNHVFAVAPVMTANLAAADYLEQQKVPFLGWSIEPRWCDKQYGFGFTGNDCDVTQLDQVSDFVVQEQKLFPDGNAQGKTIALTSEDNNSATVALRSFASIWQQHGTKVVLVDTSMPTPPAVVNDYTPYAEKILTSNAGKPPDFVTTVNSVSDTLGLYKKLMDLGYKGIVQDFTLYDPRLAAATKGLVTTISFAPFEEASTNSAVKQMVTDLRAIQPNIVLSQPAAAGYWTMDLLIAMLKKAGPNLTRASFMQAANNNFSYDYGGGAGTVNYPHDHHGNVACQAFVRSNGSTFDVPVPLSCDTLIKNPLKK
jgi:ABC-type branched-subunit amino acid transport system substrate-binding protein